MLSFLTLKFYKTILYFLGHGWFFAKVNISNILLLDYFGGAAHIPVQEYFNATPY